VGGRCEEAALPRERERERERGGVDLLAPPLLSCSEIEADVDARAMDPPPP
jgi:hypothetical protein